MKKNNDAKEKLEVEQDFDVGRSSLSDDYERVREKDLINVQLKPVPVRPSNVRRLTAESEKNIRQEQPLKEIGVAFTIFRLADISETLSQFACFFSLSMTWKDPDLVKAEPSQVDWQNQWKPLLTFLNVVKLETLSQRYILNSPETGGVKFSGKFHGTFVEQLELHRFPFDQQFLRIRISVERPINEVLLIQQPLRNNVQIPTPLAEWIVHDPDYLIDETAPSSSGQIYSEYQILGRLTRRHGYYMWNVVLIMFLIVNMCFISFFINHEDLGSRMEIILTLFLTSVAFKYVIESNLPKIQYTTLLDKYIVAAFLIQFFIAIEATIVSRLPDAKADTVDLVCFIFFAITWQILHLGFFLATIKTSIFWRTWAEMHTYQLHRDSKDRAHFSNKKFNRVDYSAMSLKKHSAKVLQKHENKQ
eukprot:Lithocolla_globosa_v1_NODE_4403_length_1444_cov_7.344852.p1 type:complete len:418 gc:universal NODE_4403_length_1444_cov_7.344852:175-1428(+)